MADKKLTYQMVSPGDAWNNFVNSKDGHNAAAVTPSYLDDSKQQQATQESSTDKPNAPRFFTGKSQPQNSISQDNQQQPTKDVSTPTIGMAQKSNAPGFFTGKPMNENNMADTKSKNTDRGIEMGGQ